MAMAAFEESADAEEAAAAAAAAGGQKRQQQSGTKRARQSGRSGQGGQKRAGGQSVGGSAEKRPKKQVLIGLEPVPAPRSAEEAARVELPMGNARWVLLVSIFNLV